MGVSIGDIVQIHSYKHDKSIHRIWQKTKILQQTTTMLVAGNNHTKVVEVTGRKWVTREPAICFFFKDFWFNVIAMIKKNGIYYYCNLSSPYVFDGEAIKYIDYDLDIRVNPDMSYALLDENEFQAHCKKMNYDEKIIFIIRESQKELIKKIENQEFPFKKEDVSHYYKNFRDMQKWK
ncbi:MAG: DUF402 domain-containing protein [Erysipelotrichales bacterium]|nr:DUF402 domain-containing protein [Erysipelotrichales bacterium]